MSSKNLYLNGMNLQRPMANEANYMFGGHTGQYHHEKYEERPSLISPHAKNGLDENRSFLNGGIRSGDRNHQVAPFFNGNSNGITKISGQTMKQSSSMLGGLKVTMKESNCINPNDSFIPFDEYQPKSTDMPGNNNNDTIHYKIVHEILKGDVSHNVAVNNYRRTSQAHNISKTDLEPQSPFVLSQGQPSVNTLVLPHQQGNPKVFHSSMKSSTLACLLDTFSNTNNYKESNTVLSNNNTNEVPHLREQLDSLNNNIEEVKEKLARAHREKDKFVRERLREEQLIENTKCELNENIGRLLGIQKKQKCDGDALDSILMELNYELKGKEDHFQRNVAEIEDLKRTLESTEKRLFALTHDPKGCLNKFQPALKEHEVRIQKLENEIGVESRRLNELLEEKCLIKEDISGRLLQRAELVAIREEYENAIDEMKAEYEKEIKHMFTEMTLQDNINSINEQIETLRAKKEQLTVSNGDQSPNFEENSGIHKSPEEDSEKKKAFAIGIIEKISELCSAEPKCMKQMSETDYEEVKAYLKGVIFDEGSKNESQLAVDMADFVRDLLLDKSLDCQDAILRILEEKVFPSILQCLGLRSSPTKDQKIKVLEVSQLSQIQQVEKELAELEDSRQGFLDEMMERNIVFEEHVIARSEEEFNKYLANNQGYFTEIGQAYGDRVLAQFKKEQLQELIDHRKEELEKNLSDLRQMLTTAKGVDKTIERNMSIVDNEILTSLKSNLEKIEEIKRKIKKMKKKIEKIKEKYDVPTPAVIQPKCNQETEEDLSLKIQETRKKISRFAAQNEEITRRIVDLNNEKAILQAQGRNNQLSAREAHDLPQLKSNLQELEVNGTDNLRKLEEEIMKAENNITAIKKSLESLEFQKYDVENRILEINYNLNNYSSIVEESRSGPIIPNEDIIKVVDDFDDEIALNGDHPMEHGNGRIHPNKENINRGYPHELKNDRKGQLYHKNSPEVSKKGYRHFLMETTKLSGQQQNLIPQKTPSKFTSRAGKISPANLSGIEQHSGTNHNNNSSQNNQSSKNYLRIDPELDAEAARKYAFAAPPFNPNITKGSPKLSNQLPGIKSSFLMSPEIPNDGSLPNLNERSRSQTGTNLGKYMKAKSPERFPKAIPTNAIRSPMRDAQPLLESLKPLLEGVILFKKLASALIYKQPAFNPLMSQTNPPEVCGYAVRIIKMNKTMEKLEVRQTIKPGIEGYIFVNQLSKIFIPQITVDILASQQVLGVLEEQPGEEVIQYQQTKTTAAQNAQYYCKVENCSYYPFSLLLDKAPSIEFVAPNQRIFLESIQLLRLVILNKKSLKKLAKFE